METTKEQRIVDLCYRLAKIIRNKEGAAPTNLGTMIGLSLSELRAIDTEKYDELVLGLDEMVKEESFHPSCIACGIIIGDKETSIDAIASKYSHGLFPRKCPSCNFILDTPSCIRIITGYNRE